MADAPAELDLRKLQRKGTLQSLLDWAGRPGTAAIDLLSGHPGGAGREAMDFLLGPARALTGDLIPELSRPEDARTLASVAGVTEPGLAKTGLDIAGAALNPLTYVGFGKGRGVRFAGKTIAAKGETVDPLTLIGKGAAKLVEQLPEKAQDYVGRVKQGAKNTLGWHDLNSGELDLLSAGAAQRTNVGRAGMSQVHRIMKGLGNHEREAVFDVLNDLKHGVDDKGKTVWGSLGGGDISARLAAHAIAPEFKPRVAKALEEVQAYTKAQLEEGKALGIFDKSAVGADDYIQRSYSGLTSEPEQRLLGGTPAVTKHRSLRSGEELSKFLNENPEVKIERDAAVALTRRAETQGRLAQQAELSKKLLEAEKLKPASAHKVLGVAFTNLGDQKVRTGVETILNNMKLARPDMFHALGTALKGMPKRNVIEETLNFGNNTFKPAAIYGIGFPRIGSIIRNTIAFPFQAGAVEGMPASVALTQAKNIPKVLLGALDDAVAKGLGSRVVKGAHLSADFDMIEQAFQNAGGVAANARAALKAAGRDDLNFALDHGVLDNFVSADKMLGSLRGSGLWRWAMNKVGLSRDRQQKIFDIAEMPADAFQGTEQRARLTMFRELMDPKTHKMNAQDAARMVKSSFYDYTSMHPHNRTLRTIIPFAAFATNAIRQQGKFLSRVPAAATVLGGLYGGGDNSQPMYPYMAGQAHVGIGRNEQGDPQYLSGFGLPMEALNQIPNLTGGNGGDELLRTLVGSTAPTIKTAAAYTFNKDPFFQTPFGSYDKTPLLLQKAGAPASGTFGRLYNEAAGTGLIQPITNVVDQVGRAIDPRLGIGAKIADLGLGARVTTVDENKAMQQILDRYLQSLPQVQKSTHLYQRSKDPETQAVLHQLEATKKKINDRRKAEMAGEASAAPASQLRM